jgi:hypothetical protein
MRQPEETMNVHSRIPSDIIGLTTPPPLSRRSFFMTASAAAAAGYTLAAGPVRAQVITTDTKGLKDGTATVKVNGGNMPVYFARPANVKNPPVILVAMETLDCTNTSATSRAASPRPEPSPLRRTIISGPARI